MSWRGQQVDVPRADPRPFLGEPESLLAPSELSRSCALRAVMSWAIPKVPSSVPSRRDTGPSS